MKYRSPIQRSANKKDQEQARQAHPNAQTRSKNLHRLTIARNAIEKKHQPKLPHHRHQVGQRVENSREDCKLCNASGTGNLNKINELTLKKRQISEDIRICRMIVVVCYNANLYRYEREEYRCGLCSYACTIEKAFERHLRAHARGQAQEKRLSCAVCGADRCSELDLSKHMRRHRDNRYFCCDICIFRTVQLKKVRNKHVYFFVLIYMAAVLSK